MLILIPWKHCSCFHCVSYLAPKPLGLNYPAFAIFQLLYCHCKSGGHTFLFPHSNSPATTEPNEAFLLIWFLWSNTCQVLDHRTLACVHSLQDPELACLQLVAETTTTTAAQVVCTEAIGTLNSCWISSSLQVLEEKGIHWTTGLFLQKYVTVLFSFLLLFLHNDVSN